MRQLTSVGFGHVELWDVSKPRIQDSRDAIVRPWAVTRCDPDLVIVSGRAGLSGPFAVGHDTSGEVIWIGDAVSAVAPGDLVIVPFQISCGECPRCRRARTNACTGVPFRSYYGLKPVSGVEYGGALSDYPRSVRRPYAGAAPQRSCPFSDRRPQPLPTGRQAPLPPSPGGFWRD